MFSTEKESVFNVEKVIFGSFAEVSLFTPRCHLDLVGLPLQPSGCCWSLLGFFRAAILCFCHDFNLSGICRPISSDWNEISWVSQYDWGGDSVEQQPAGRPRVGPEIKGLPTFWWIVYWT